MRRFVLLIMLCLFPGCGRTEFDSQTWSDWRAEKQIPLEKRTRAKLVRVDHLARFLKGKTKEFVDVTLGEPDMIHEGTYRYEMGYDMIDAYRLEIRFNESNSVELVEVSHT